MITPEAVRSVFRQFFGAEPEAWALAPGRVNLIGEHTDYTGGFVLPAAIDRCVAVAARRVTGPSCRLYSQTLQREVVLDLDDLHGASDFGRYVAGIAWALGGKVAPVDAAIVSDLPIESGISSSAALEIGFAALWNLLDGRGLSPLELAQVGKRAENGFVGLQSGIMDQLASAAGRRGHCLLIDTRSLESRPVRLPPDLAIVVCDTKKRRGLTESAYNERVEECRLAAEALGVPSLRDATPALLAQANLPDPIGMRARHVVTENERVHRFVEALECSDRAKIGMLMAESHESLRADYQVSCPELDAMEAAARNSSGCAGVRMTGAGFGGCCVSLVERTLSEDFVTETTEFYRRTLSLTPEFLVCEASEGAMADFFGS